MLAFGHRLRRLKALTGSHQPAFMPPSVRRQNRRQFLPPRHLCADFHRHRQQRTALVDIVEEGPTPAIHGVVRWRIIDLCQWLFEEFRICASETTVSRELRKMGYRKLSARPRHHAQREGAIEDFKKVFPPAWRKSPARKASTHAR